MRAVSVVTAQEAGLGREVAKPVGAQLNVRASPDAFGYTAARELGQFGQVAGQASDELASFAKRDAYIQAHQQALDGALAWHARLNDLQQSAPAGAPGFAKQVGDEFGKWKQSQLDAAPNEVAKEALGTRLDELELSVNDKAAAFQDTANTAHRKTQLKASFDSALSLAMVEPENADNVLRGQLDLIRKSGLPATAQEALALDQTQAVKAAQVRGLAEKDPAAVANGLANGAFAGLDYQDRLELFNHASGLVRQQQAQVREDLRWQHTQRREAEQDARQARDDREKATEDKLTGLALDPSVTGEQKMAALREAVGKRAIGGSKARALAGFFKEGQGGGGGDDFHAIAGIVAAQQANAPDVGEQIARAQGQGLLKTSTAKSMLEDEKRRQQAGGPLASEAAKRAEKMVSDLVAPHDMLGNILGAENAEKEWRALRVFRDGVAADPKGDPFKIADQAIASVKDGAAQGAAGAGPATPKFLVGPREKPDAAASLARVTEAVGKGEATAEDVTELEKYLDGYFATHPDQRPQP
jgi:hypothetical protein